MLTRIHCFVILDGHESRQSIYCGGLHLPQRRGTATPWCPLTDICTCLEGPLDRPCLTTYTGEWASTLHLNPLQSGIQNGRHEKYICTNLRKFIFGNIFFHKIVVLNANTLDPMPGPTYVGPGFGSSLFATV